MEEVDAYPAPARLVEAVGGGLHRVETEPVQLGHEGGQAAPPALAAGHGLFPEAPTEASGVVPLATKLLGEGGKETGHEGVGGRVETDAGSPRSQ